ncbi:hypothetical protein MKY34_19480 [Sporosarcina sp. FSL K6-1522]|uniref:hypothetical protein n=1 Tax=Sporosarcina sp. FSL K6-1522 TaxID=2921554 RepID=UPI00315A092E
MSRVIARPSLSKIPNIYSAKAFLEERIVDSLPRVAAKDAIWAAEAFVMVFSIVIAGKFTFYWAYCI